MTHGSASGVADRLDATPVLRIVEVKQGSTVYQENRDYVQSGDTISWAPNGQEPAPGSQYTVKYQYINTFNANVARGRLQLNAADAQNIVPDTTMSVTYDFYLTRIDRIVIDQNTRTLKVLKGIPATYSDALPPILATDEMLNVGTITLQYGIPAQINQDDAIYMVPFSSIKKMQDQIGKLNYNVAQLSLRDEARSYDPVTNKRGIVVDSLSNGAMRDEGIPQNAVIESGILTVGTSWTEQFFLNTQPIKLPVSVESAYSEQNVRTGDQRINPYAVPNSNPVAEITTNTDIIYGNAWDAGYNGDVLPRSVVINGNLKLFNANEQVQLTFRGKVVKTVQTNGKGESTFDLTIPEGTPYSTYTISAKGLISKAEASCGLTVDRNDDTYQDFMNQKLAAETQRQGELLQSQIDALNSKLDESLRAVNRRIDELGNRISSMQSAMSSMRNDLERKIADNVPAYWIQYYDTDNRKTSPNGFLKVYASSIVSNGGIQYNQGSNTVSPGSQMFEMGVIASQDIVKRVTVHQNDDDVNIFVNGNRVWGRGISGSSDTVDLRLRRGENLIQVVLNNKGNNLSHLQMSGDIVDRNIVRINQNWGRGALSDAQGRLGSYEEELRRKREEESRIQAERNNRRRSWSWANRMTDPVAQSFVPSRDFDLSAVSFYITEKPTKDITCKIVQNLAGQPDITKMIGFGRLALSSVNAGWNKLTLDSTVSLKKDQEYSVVIITESFEGKVAIAKVGDRNLDNFQYVKSQVDTGVLFLSANERTWISVQDSDLTYKLHATTYQSNVKNKLLTIAGSSRQENLTDFKLVGSMNASNSHSIRFFMTVGGKEYDLPLNKTINIPTVTKAVGNIDVYYEMSTTLASSSPVIAAGLMFMTGKADTPSTYVTRQWDIKNGATQAATIQVILDQLVESGTSITPSFQHGNNDSDFTDITRKVSSENIGDGWQTVVYETSAPVQRPYSRLKLNMTATDYANRPKVKNIRILIV